MGEGISYEYKGKNHIHLFLSSFAVTNIVGPEYGWTSSGQQLFVNALNWAMETEQEVPSVPVWDEKQLRSCDKPVVVTGTTDAFTTVYIYVEQGRNRTLLASVQVKGDGTFEANIDLKNGNYFLVAEAANFAGVSETSEQMQLIVTGTNQKSNR